MSSEIPGADLLMNTAAMSAPDTKMADLEQVSLNFTDLPSEPLQPPKLVPSANDVGATKTWDGVENLNAEAYLKPVNVQPKMSDDALMKRKYELLRKFDRLTKLGVPMRKRFTMDSPLDEMEMELEFVRREKAMDSTIKQFSEWFITGMSALEWGSKNVAMMKAFGLQLDGLSQSAQMNVADLEEDFEEVYDLYGENMRMHPLVRIPMRTCFMVYMVHLTNQMAMKAPVPNIQEILKNNPDIARQMAAQAMQTQTQQFKQQAASAPAPAPAPPAPAGGLAGMMSFLSGINQPPPQSESIKSIPARQPAREMKPPSGMGIGDILKNIQTQERKISSPMAPPVRAQDPAPQVQVPTFAPPHIPPPPKPSLKTALRKSAQSEARKSAKNSVVIKL